MTQVDRLLGRSGRQETGRGLETSQSVERFLRARVGADRTGSGGGELVAVVTHEFRDLASRAQQHPHLAVVQVLRVPFGTVLRTLHQVTDVASATVVARNASMCDGHGRRPFL
ncbi:hypothetical protein ACFWN1_08230 [Streptomyces sp. NPDC058459]|uniref:hypothetical protein n=1 Tax=Streptomyces sp. NPDC058459 TaxID=3346508 RepID=UPI003651FE4B